MLRSIFTFILFFTLLTHSQSSAWASASDKKTVILLMKIQTPQNLKKPQKYRSREVIRYLKEGQVQQERNLKNFISKSLISSQDVKIKNSFWVNQSFSVIVTEAGLNALKKYDQILKIYPNLKLPQERIQNSNPVYPDDLYSMKEIKLDLVRKEFPELTGKGAIIGHVDSGVDGKHFALRGKVLKFFDAKNQIMTEPFDFGEHGTHTAGTIVGSHPPTKALGIAPDAKLISTAATIDYDIALTGIQWITDPDKNPNTNDFPKVINNSWNSTGAPDQELFYRAVSAWDAVGILPVFSAGNDGPGKETIAPPKSHPATLAVGATDPNGKIRKYSSRGPGNYKGQITQKPELTAPGGDINSSIPGDEYSHKSGTSMAAPHVTGVIALLLQINPQFTSEQLRKLLILSADPKAEGGRLASKGEWNKTYGFGKMNSYNAVKMAKAVSEKLIQKRSLSFNFLSTPLDLQENRVLEEDHNSDLIDF